MESDAGGELMNKHPAIPPVSVIIAFIVIIIMLAILKAVCR